MNAALSITTSEAQAILAPFNCVVPKIIQSPQEKEMVRQAVLQLARVTDNQIFGVLADTWPAALGALQTYTQALGYPNPPEVEQFPGSDAIYLKFNVRSGLCYSSPYLGDHRGVLISFQSDLADGVNEMTGHLPLDLFEGESVV